MCNHFRARPDLIESWRVWSGHDLRQPNRPVAEDVYPRRSALVIRRDIEGAVKADAMTWGFQREVPGARPGTTRKTNVTNVRNLTSPFWANMLASPVQRCLVPWTTFAEPVIGGGRAEHWFSLQDEPVGAFAAIWRMAGDEPTFAFCTTEPNALVAPLHPKAMPVILAEADYDQWLTVNRAAACALVRPFPAERMALN